MSSSAVAPRPSRDIVQAGDRPHGQALIDVVHELRAPLTAISGALDLLASGQLGAIGADAARMLTVARENSHRMARLIDGLLASGRDASDQPKIRERIDLAELLDQAIRSNQGLMTGRGQFALTSCVTPAIVRGNRDALHQVLNNLLSNAVKFGPAEGQVCLALRHTSRGFRISVSDHGSGIPPDFRPMLFRRFARAPQIASRVPGTGLGLSIARAIVRAHGGAIRCESKVGRGTTFHVDLPADDSP